LVRRTPTPGLLLDQDVQVHPGAFKPSQAKGSSDVRKLVASEYVSLDGVMEEPGKWSFPFWNDEAAKFKFDELFASDALLLGRVTYQGFAAAWPSMTDEAGFADRMNSVPKYVVSTTLETAEWNNSRLIKGNIPEEVSKLKQQPGQDILIGGSGQLVRALLPHNLIDEYRFMVYPIILGSGKRLFTDMMDTKTLQLVECKTTSTGVLLLTYRPPQPTQG
jgi:dihydrofolate reductase